MSERQNKCCSRETDIEKAEASVSAREVACRRNTEEVAKTELTCKNRED